MKRRNLILISLLALCALLLAACGGGGEGVGGQEADGAVQGESSAVQGDSGAADGESVLPRTVTLDATLPIFDEPSYDGVYQRIVGEDGVYTVVEEADDGEGSRWGKLKSGVGWIDLTAAEAFAAAPKLLSVCYAEEPLLQGAYVEETVEESEYTVRLALRPSEALTELRVYSMTFAGEDFVPDRQLAAFQTLAAKQPLVLGVTFPGDMSCYAVACRDSAGEEHWYTLSLSGRNGLPIMSDYTGATP